MNVWITKYALTKGIFEMDVESQSEGCKTKAAAIAKAEKMRRKKIASLKKQIEKLESMKFE